MDQFRLFSLPAWLPFHLWLLWPLIFWRICRLEAWYRAAGGPGSQMMWYVDCRGRVRVAWLSDDLSGKGRAARLPQPSARYLAALDGSLSDAACPGAPEAAHPRAVGDLVPHAPACPGRRRAVAVPIPDT